MNGCCLTVWRGVAGYVMKEWVLFDSVAGYVMKEWVLFDSVEGCGGLCDEGMGVV